MSSCWFFFLYFFSFLLIVMPICALSLAHGHPPTLSPSLSLSSLGIVCRRNFWLSWLESGVGGCCSRQPETSSSNNTYKSFVRLVWLGQLLLLLSRLHALLLLAVRVFVDNFPCCCCCFFFLNVLFFLFTVILIF